MTMPLAASLHLQVLRDHLKTLLADARRWREVPLVLEEIDALRRRALATVQALSPLPGAVGVPSQPVLTLH